MRREIIKTLTVPLRVSLAVLDLLGLNGGRAGKTSSEPDNGRDGGDTHIDHV
jgi:hypothetical protein